ncbi:MAG: TspO/MBR family protein [Reyranellaceae bacterium]
MLALLAFVAVCLGIGAIGGAVVSTSVATWYRALHKPPFNPPDWVFGPVWAVLYVAMAVAGWRAWRRLGSVARPAMWLFAIQLALNLMWSILFFGLHRIGMALVEIVVLLAVIAATAVAFWRVDKAAGLLFVPYVAWVGFATVLNAALWHLN